MIKTKRIKVGKETRLKFGLIMILGINLMWFAKKDKVIQEQENKEVKGYLNDKENLLAGQIVQIRINKEDADKYYWNKNYIKAL